jgi:hypothetical protein
LDSNTGSELIVFLAWRSAEIAAVAALLMLLFALGTRRYLQYQERVHARVIATWRPLLTRIAIEEGERPALPALRPSHLPHLMEEWNALHDALRGESADKLNAVAIRLGLDIAARRMIHARGIGRRILAIRTLGHLRDPSSWRPLQDQLASPNSIVSFYAAAALVQIDAQRAMPGIMLQLAERESWPAEAMARLLVDVNADIARDPVRSLMLSLAPSKVPPLLPWLAHVDAVLGSEVAVELMRRSPDNGVREYGPSHTYQAVSATPCQNVAAGPKASAMSRCGYGSLTIVSGHRGRVTPSQSWSMCATRSVVSSWR